MSETKKIIPKCKGGKHSSCTAEGRWMPCCSFPTKGKEFNKSIFSKSNFLIDINNKLDFWESDLFNLWLDKIEEDYDSAYVICKKLCSEVAHETEKNIEEMNWVMEEKYEMQTKEDLIKFLKEHDIDFS